MANTKAARQPILVRFVTSIKINAETGCWEWMGSRSKAGYGQIHMGPKKQYAHRLAWKLCYGEWPSQYICHRCDNPRCCNPAHFFLGTHKDNQRDKSLKGLRQFNLTEDQVREIFIANAGWATLAARHGIPVSLVKNIRIRKRWTHITDPLRHQRGTEKYRPKKDITANISA